MAKISPLGPTTTNLVARLLDEPDLPGELALLDGAEWKSIVREVGLEDVGEFLAFATGEQLLELLDEDLWTSADSGREELDVARFATFLEVLRDAAPRDYAKKVSELSEEFLVHAIGSLVMILPRDFLEAYAVDDEEGLVDKKIESQLVEELDGYFLLSRQEEGWDALLDLLTSWNESNAALAERVLSRLAAAQVRSIDDVDELVAALEGLEEVREEAEAEREERRAKKGYVSRADARAFLRLPAVEVVGERDAISAAHFRRLDGASGKASPTKRDGTLGALLGRANRKPLLSESSRPLRSAMNLLRETRPEKHARFQEELAFLVNVVLAASEEEVTNPADAFAEVARRVEAGRPDQYGAVENDDSARFADALLEWGPIGLFRKKKGLV